MWQQSLRVLLGCLGFALSGCGGAANVPPSVDAFTLDAPSKGTGMVALMMTATITVSDANHDKIPRVELSATGPTRLPAQSMTLPSGSSGTYQLIFGVVGTVLPGEYTCAAVAYDEDGMASAPKTAKFVVQ